MAYKLKKILKKLSIIPIIVFLTFILISIWFLIGVNNIKAASDTQQENEAYNCIKKSVILCYSLEGTFPPNLDYLRDKYGLGIDEDKYFIDYQAYGSNIMPYFQVELK